MPLRPRPEIESLGSCAHGGINYAELRTMGFEPEDILDFSVCSNPYAPPLSIRRAISRAAIDRYPDSDCATLRQSLATTQGVPADSIIAGSGSTELIRLIALAYFRPGDAVIIPQPAFGEYEMACRIAGARCITPGWGEKEGFEPDIDEITGLIGKHHARAVFLCNPNNPTGKYLPHPAVEPILTALTEGILVLDEAYVPFVEGSWASTGLLARGNLVILRSMTKDYNLAGLRLGYALTDKAIIDVLRRVCPPWNVNAVAQAAGIEALRHPDYVERSKEKIKRAKQFLVDELSQLGFCPTPSDANFFLVKVGCAAEFRAALLKCGILVRDCTSFGLPEYVRISPRTLPECRRLISAIEAMIKGGGLKAIS